MTVCLPAPSVSHGLHITNSLSARRRRVQEAAGLPFKADSIYTESHQRPGGSSVSNEQLVFECLSRKFMTDYSQRLNLSYIFFIIILLFHKRRINKSSLINSYQSEYL